MTAYKKLPDWKRYYSAWEVDDDHFVTADSRIHGGGLNIRRKSDGLPVITGAAARQRLGENHPAVIESDELTDYYREGMESCGRAEEQVRRDAHRFRW